MRIRPSHCSLATSISRNHQPVRCLFLVGSRLLSLIPYLLDSSIPLPSLYGYRVLPMGPWYVLPQRCVSKYLLKVVLRLFDEITLLNLFSFQSALFKLMRRGLLGCLTVLNDRKQQQFTTDQFPTDYTGAVPEQTSKKVVLEELRFVLLRTAI